MSEITSNVPLDNINWDYGIVVSYVRITAPSGTFVARICLSDNGLQYTSYRQDSAVSIDRLMTSFLPLFQHG